MSEQQTGEVPETTTTIVEMAARSGEESVLRGHQLAIAREPLVTRADFVKNGLPGAGHFELMNTIEVPGENTEGQEGLVFGTFRYLLPEVSPGMPQEKVVTVAEVNQALKVFTDPEKVDTQARIDALQAIGTTLRPGAKVSGYEEKRFGRHAELAQAGVIVNSPAVERISREQFAVAADIGGAVVVKDTNSANGTRIRYQPA